MRLLKQSTSTTLLLGPFVDETDGKTAETGLTISQADVLLWKEGGTTLAQKTEATSCTHRSNGLYTCPIDGTDTGTVGTLVVSVHESGALPVRQDYTVVPANVYDSLVAGSGTDRLQVDVQEVMGTAATKLGYSVGSMVIVTVGVGSTATDFVLTDLSESTADHYKGRIYIGVTGALAGQATDITASATNALTVTATTDAPAQNDIGIIV